MMRMAQGTLRDDKNAISSHLPSVRGGFSGKIVTDGNPSTLLCPNHSEMTNAHIMQTKRTQQIGTLNCGNDEIGNAQGSISQNCSQCLGQS